jgi:hypothetical protein
MSGPPAWLLDRVLLDRFEPAFQSVGAETVLGALGPGVAGGELDAIEARIGMRLADEART